MIRASCYVTTVVLVLGFGSNAAATPHDAAAAETLFRDGREAMKRGDFTFACPKLAESQRLDPAAGTLLNLAQCEAGAGRLASAWQHAREAMDQLPPGDERGPIAKKLAADLDKRAPRLVVRLAADALSGTTVTRDDVELGRPSLGTKLPVDPGEHVVVVRAPGRRDARFTVTLAEGDAKTLDVNTGEGVSARGSAAPEDHATPGSASLPSRGDGQRTLGYGFAGAGVLLAGTGMVVGLLGRSHAIDAIDRFSLARDARDDVAKNAAGSDYDSASTQAATGWIVAGIGGAALVTGIVLIASAPSSAAKSEMRVGPWMGDASGGLALAGKW